jgi:dipeptidase E
LKNLIIASTSTVHGGEFLDYLLDELIVLFENTNDIVFVPFARPGGITHELYTEKVNAAFKKIGKTVKGLHEFSNPIEAIENAKGIFIGGGNTFVLVHQLYQTNLIQPIQNAVLSGMPYLGTSAGSNICGLTMNTTNDMPIIYPPSFKTLALIPFNINPHYLDPEPNSKHMGETRETRIQEFHQFNTQPVVGLREGSFLRVIGNDINLKGPHTARVFEYNKTPYEVDSNSSLNNIK